MAYIAHKKLLEKVNCYTKYIETLTWAVHLDTYTNGYTILGNTMNEHDFELTMSDMLHVTHIWDCTCNGSKINGMTKWHVILWEKELSN